MDIDRSHRSTQTKRRYFRVALLAPFTGAIGVGLAVASMVGAGDDVSHVCPAAADTVVEHSDAQDADEASLPRLTPTHDELPELPPQSELEASAAQVPDDERQSVWPGDIWFGLPGYWGGPAHPVFSYEDNSLAGVMVSGVGVVGMDVYEDPAVDLEELLVERVGASEYDAQRQQLADVQSCVEDSGAAVSEPGEADPHPVAECMSSAG